MKNFRILTLAFIAITTLATTSCSDDDDAAPAVVPSQFTYDGVTYQLDKGFIDEFGDNGNGTFDFDIFLFTEGLTIDPATADVSGTGQAVYLDLNSDSMTGLSDGTYLFAMDREAFTIVPNTGVLINLDTAAQTGTLVPAVGGDVILSKEGNIYELEYTLVDASGLEVVGSYRGELANIE